MKAVITHRSQFCFDLSIRDHKLAIDSQVSAGGQNLGPTPKELLLGGIIGCAGMDVVGILKKHKMTPDSFAVSAEADTRKEHPRIFTGVDAVFEATGANIGSDEFYEAVKLSMTKYCGVSAMVSKTVPIRYKVVLNGKDLGEGLADFGL
jgi:putative redox protein